LILRQRVTRRRPENAIDWTVVITELGKPRLDSLDRRISRRRASIDVRGVIVRLNVRVVVVRIVVVGVIRQVIPWKESVI
jgi:hypothetical protein